MIRYPFRIGLLLFAIAALCSATVAQIPGGMNEVTRTGLGGNNFIVGTVFLPTGRPADYRIQIRLASRARGDIMSSTDQRGQFIFSGLSEGQYTVVIESEKEFEPFNYTVDVTPQATRGGAGQTFTVTARLVERKNSQTKAGVVYTEDATASKKAVGLFTEAMSLSTGGDHKAAAGKLKEAVADSPKYISALNQLGSEYMVLGDLEKAEAPLRAAVAVDGSAYEPLANLGILLFRSKKYSESRSMLTRALEANGSAAVAHFYLGRIYHAEGQPDAAIKHLNESVRLGDRFKEAHRILAVLYIDKQDHKKVVDELEIYLKLVPEARDAEDLRSIIKQHKAAPPK